LNGILVSSEASSTNQDSALKSIKGVPKKQGQVIEAPNRFSSNFTPSFN
jgi:hypothetical protein